MRILHGENTVASRNRLAALIADAKAKNMSVVRFDATALDVPILENALLSQSLFGQEKLLVIDQLHSLPKSKKKDDLIIMLSVTEMPVVMWEKKMLTAPMLKKFPNAHVDAFPLTNVLFKWLDTITGKPNPVQQQQMLTLLQQALKSDGDFMCFTMLVRQVRILLQVKDGDTDTLPPFLRAKAQKQATSFSLEQLLRLHHALLEMDVRQKTSQSVLGLGRELEFFLLTL